MQPTTSFRNYFKNILPDQVKSNQAYKDLRYHKWKTAEEKIDDRTDVAGIQIRFLNSVPYYVLGFSGESDSKESAGNAGDTGSIPGWGTKIPRVAEEQSPCATTREFVHYKERSSLVQLRPEAAK